MGTNPPFIGSVKEGVGTFVYITELAVIRILDQHECKGQRGFVVHKAKRDVGTAV